MIDLNKYEKRKEEAKISLEKRELPNQKAQVILIVDNSGSMAYEYSSGLVQETFERLLPLANTLDDDGKMPVLSFDDHIKNHGDATIDNAEGFIKRANLWGRGGTAYKPVIDEVLGYRTDIPTLAICITDGDNQDKPETTEAIINASAENIFFQFVGIGTREFTYLDQINNICGRHVDNVGFFKIEDISDISDSELYDMLISEFPKWLKDYEAKKDQIQAFRDTHHVKPKKKGILDRLFGR